MTYKGGASGVVGIAWTGVVCYPDYYKGYRVGINEWFGSDLTSAEVIFLHLAMPAAFVIGIPVEIFEEFHCHLLH